MDQVISLCETCFDVTIRSLGETSPAPPAVCGASPPPPSGGDLKPHGGATAKLCLSSSAKSRNKEKQRHEARAPVSPEHGEDLKSHHASLTPVLLSWMSRLFGSLLRISPLPPTCFQETKSIHPHSRWFHFPVR